MDLSCASLDPLWTRAHPVWTSGPVLDPYLTWCTQRTWGISTDRSLWKLTLRPKQKEAPLNRKGPTSLRPTNLQLCPYMGAARLMALLWPGPDTPTQNYLHLMEEDMPGIQLCFFSTLDYHLQTNPHILEQIRTPPE